MGIWQIIFLVIGIIILVILFSLVIYFVIFNQKRRKEIQEAALIPFDVDEFINNLGEIDNIKQLKIVKKNLIIIFKSERLLNIPALKQMKQKGIVIKEHTMTIKFVDDMKHLVHLINDRLK